MANGDKLLGAVSKLNEDGNLSPEITGTLALAALTDVLVVVREIKNDNIVIKESVRVLLTNQGTNKEEIDLLRKRSWMADAVAGALAAVGIFLGVNK